VAKKTKTRLETWKAAPDLHDFPAAASYLSLLLPDATAAELADRLRTATTAYWKAKDLLRASGLARLPVTDVHVAGDLSKVARGEQLSPVLLVRGSATEGRALIVADGYHRVCASYSLDEDTDIPCRLVDLP
jgi:hypothetical protein